MKLDEQKDRTKEQVEKSRGQRQEEMRDRYLYRDQILKEIGEIEESTEDIKEQKQSV